MLSPLQVRTLQRGERLLTPVCILFATAVAWVYLLRLEQQMSSDVEYRVAMAAMGMSIGLAWTFQDVLLTFGIWVVMMVGMMAPSAGPVLLLFISTRPRLGGGWASVLETGAFTLGYFVVWTGYSAMATVLQWLLREGALLSDSMALSDEYLSGSVMIAAGLYQLTTWKRVCLSRCRSPLGFLMEHWRAGKWGAFRMGIGHGVFCLGCCWALMTVLFAVGMMNLVWVAALTVFVLLEKVGPYGPVFSRLGGATLVLLGGLTIVRLF